MLNVYFYVCVSGQLSPSVQCEAFVSLAVRLMLALSILLDIFIVTSE